MFTSSLGASQVYSETGPYTQRAQRDWGKRQATPDWCVAGFISKGICIQGLSWVAARWVDLHTCLPSLQSLHRVLNWVRSSVPFRWSQHHITVSRPCPSGSLWDQARQAEAHSKDGEGISNLWFPRSGSGWSHLLTSSNAHNAKLFFIMILSMCHPTTNVWWLIFSCPLVSWICYYIFFFYFLPIVEVRKWRFSFWIISISFSRMCAFFSSIF